MKSITHLDDSHPRDLNHLHDAGHAEARGHSAGSAAVLGATDAILGSREVVVEGRLYKIIMIV